MKHLAPILSRNSTRKCSALAAHSTHRKSVRVGILDRGQAASVLSFRMHQPERFEGNCAGFRYRRELHGMMLHRLFSGLPRPWQRCLESPHPVPHRAPTQAIVVAVFAARDAASKPRLNVDRPVSTASAAFVVPPRLGLISHLQTPLAVSDLRGKLAGNSGGPQECDDRTVTGHRPFLLRVAMRCFRDE